MRFLASLATFLGALIVALAALGIAIGLVGDPPIETVGVLILGAFGSVYGLSETLLRTVPLLLCALAAGIPGRAGQINIGGEGQFHLGAIGLALFSGYLGLSATLPGLVVAILFGMLWAAIPALLRVRLGLSEALISLFLNYIAIYLLLYVVHGPMQDPSSHGWPMSNFLSDAALMQRWGSTRLHWGIVVAVVLGLAAIGFNSWTRRGLELRATGLGIRQSAVVGIPVKRLLVGSMLVGGALAGLAGYYEIAAVQYRLRPDVSQGFGYSGFLVAWICREHFWLILPTSVLVAGLIVGSESLRVSSSLPAAIGDVAQGFLLLFVLLSTPLTEWLRQRRELKLALKNA